MRIPTIIAGLMAAVMLVGVGQAGAVPEVPDGVTAFAGDRVVRVAWRTVQGVDEYRVYRSTSAASQGVRVSPPGHTAPSYSDTAAPTGTIAYYRVTAVSGGAETSASAPAGATPQSASCSIGNAIVRENCLPGDANWHVYPGSPVSADGIEAFTTTPSIDAGQSVDVKVDAATGAAYRIEIFRTGWYGGAKARLVGVLPGRVASKQGACVRQPGETGLRSCSNWSTTLRITTTTSWPAGVYMLRLTREDNGKHNQAMLILRDDDGAAPVVYNVPDTTYQAYNNHGTKSTYTLNSTGATTVAGTAQAVKVSFDRPYQQVASKQRDFYTFQDVAAVGWLERQGYDIAYTSSIDLHRGIPNLNSRQAIILGVHHEYWSAEMRQNLLAARNAGVDVLSLGANQIYWRVRFEDGERTMVVYKTTATGVADPSGIPTGTWRDPAGANQPENALLGGQYVGDNSAKNFGLVVSAAEGAHRMWRHTPLASLAPGTSLKVGTSIVGWEWDARAANGQEPAGTQTVATSPVDGNILQDAGGVYATGPATANATIYRAASGALVFNSGTNNWSRGLGSTSRDAGEPRSEIQQATANLLADMGVAPTTPNGITLDDAGAPEIISTTPADNDGGVDPTTNVTARFDRDLNAATVNATTFTLRPAGGGSALAAAVTYNAATRTAQLDPSPPLAAGAAFTATLTTGVTDSGGTALSQAASWTFTTAAAGVPSITQRSPLADAAGVSPGTTVTASFDHALDPATVSASSVRLSDSDGATVPAAVTYESAEQRVRLTPSSPLALDTAYTARLTTAIRSSAGTALAGDEVWSFTTRRALTVTARTPAPLSVGVATTTSVTATFDRAVDPATVTSTSFVLRDGSLASVPAAVTYDASLRTATLRPSSTLALSTTHTAELSDAIRAIDGQPLTPSTWTFQTSAAVPDAPSVVARAPGAGATEVDRAASVTASFDRALDPTSVTGATAQVLDSDGAQVAATVTYTSASSTVTIDPAAPLSRDRVYTARLTTGIRADGSGTPMVADIEWSFTTERCPCRLMEDLIPAQLAKPVRDGRPEPGPWTYEMGTKVVVTRPMDLTAIRYYKDPGEAGVHRGTVWSAAGSAIAQVDFGGESASGWQRQALSTPVRLNASDVYVVSVGLSTFYTVTQFGLQSALSDGPLRSVADGANGVYGSAAGLFPSNTYKSSNYFVDAEVLDPSAAPVIPNVTATQPADGATGVVRTTSVEATFSHSLDPASVDGSSFTLKNALGDPVAASVSYDDTSRTARLAPSAQLAAGATFTARLSTAIRTTGGGALPQAYEWSFTTANAAAAPTVLSTNPADGATVVPNMTDVRATLSEPLAVATVTGQSFTLTAFGGTPVPATVTYDDTTRTVRLVPSSSLSALTTYTARLTTAIESASGEPLAADVVWSFETSGCPCTLFGATVPVKTNVSTRDLRPLPGPWTRELGLKFEVAQPVQLSAIRYYRASSEKGAHVGTLWNATGTALAAVTFSGETSSGWQEQAFATPVQLVPGQVYVVSVGFNVYYSVTQFALTSAVISGPLRTINDGANGVYGSAAGVFPTETWKNSNYFIDIVVQ